MLEIARQKELIEGHDLNLTIFEDPLGGHAALAAGQIDVYECTADYIPLTVERGTGVVNVAFTNPSYGVDHVILGPDFIQWSATIFMLSGSLPFVWYLRIYTRGTLGSEQVRKYLLGLSAVIGTLTAVSFSRRVCLRPMHSGSSPSMSSRW